MIIVIIWSVPSFKFIDGLVLTVHCVKRYASGTDRFGKQKQLGCLYIYMEAVCKLRLQNVEISFSLVWHWPRLYRVSVIVSHEFALLLGFQSLYQLCQDERFCYFVQALFQLVLKWYKII